MAQFCTIQIAPDVLNAKKEQYKVFQRDGETIQVPIGKMVEVPLWVGVRAKEIGLISDYLLSNNVSN